MDKHARLFYSVWCVAALIRSRPLGRVAGKSALHNDPSSVYLHYTLVRTGLRLRLFGSVRKLPLGRDAPCCKYAKVAAGRLPIGRRLTTCPTKIGRTCQEAGFVDRKILGVRRLNGGGIRFRGLAAHGLFEAANAFA